METDLHLVGICPDHSSDEDEDEVKQINSQNLDRKVHIEEADEPDGVMSVTSLGSCQDGHAHPHFAEDEVVDHEVDNDEDEELIPSGALLNDSLTPFEEILDMEMTTLKIRLLSQHQAIVAAHTREQPSESSDKKKSKQPSRKVSIRRRATGYAPDPSVIRRSLGGNMRPKSPPAKVSIDSFNPLGGSDSWVSGSLISADLQGEAHSKNSVHASFGGTEEYTLKGETCKQKQKKMSGLHGQEDARNLQIKTLDAQTNYCGGHAFAAGYSPGPGAGPPPLPIGDNDLFELGRSSLVNPQGSAVNMAGAGGGSCTVMDEIPGMKIVPHQNGPPVAQAGAPGLGRRKSYLHKVSQQFHESVFEAHDVWYVDYDLIFPSHVRKTESVKSDVSDMNPDTIIEVSDFLDWMVIMPNTVKRILWDFFCIIFNLYDIIILPLAFFDLQQDDHLALGILAWITRVFWTIDIPASFITGFVTSKGKLESSFPIIARAYIRGWLSLDLLVVAADWTEYLLNATVGSDAARIGRGFRALRTLRMVRLLRLVRMSKIFKRLTEQWLTDNTRVMATVFNIVLGIMIVAHIVACVWYGIGLDSPEGRSWLSHATPPLTMPAETKWFKYITSLLWSLSELTSGGDNVAEPYARDERIFAIFLSIFAFILSTAAVSALTSSMTRFDLLTSKEAARFQALRQYMSDNHISSKLHVRVQRNAEHALAEKRRNISENDVELLCLISEPLRVELHFQVYAPVLTEHPFFAKYCQDNPAAMMHVCHSAVRSAGPYSRGDTIFTIGEVPEHPCMMFVLKGELRYARKPLGMRDLHEGSFQQLVTRFFSTAKCVDATHPSKYAMEFVKRLNNTDACDISDLTLETDVAEDVVKAFPANVRFAIGDGETPHSRLSIVEEAITNVVNDAVDLTSKFLGVKRGPRHSRSSARGSRHKTNSVRRSGKPAFRNSMDTAQTFKHASRISTMSGLSRDSSMAADAWESESQGPLSSSRMTSIRGSNLLQPPS